MTMQSAGSGGPDLILFDDRLARAWLPFTLTRPAGELRFGASTLRERAERIFGTRCSGHVTSPSLIGFEEPGAPPVLAGLQGPLQRDTVLLSSRALLEWPAKLPGVAEPMAWRIGDEPCAWFLPRGSDPPSSEFWLDPGAAPIPTSNTLMQPGRMLARVWELVTGNTEQLSADLRALFPRPPAPALAAGVHTIGSEALVLGRGVRIEPGVVFDLRAGPVWLDDDVAVSAFTRIAGPAHFGPGTQLLGGSFDAVAGGPRCKLRGEMQECVVLGYSNKAHDGYIGHAYLGAWVNLGAMTTNSDLKNNYGSISIWTPDGMVDTGTVKLGCLVGDHVKTAIGTVLNTGTVIGAGANVVAAGFPPKYIAPFQWGTGEAAAQYEAEKFLRMAETVMARRDVQLGAGQRELLLRVARSSRGEQ